MYLRLTSFGNVIKREAREARELKNIRPECIMLRALGALLTAVLVMVFSVQGALAAHKILAVQGMEARPYTQAYEGFRGVLGPDAEISRLVLSDLPVVGPQDYIRNEDPDLVLAIGMDALETVENIEGIPIVYVMILDGSGKFSNRENITGVRMVVEPEEQLEIICRAFSDSERIGVLYDPGQTGQILRRIQEAASGKNTSLVARKVYRPENVPAAFMLIRDEVDVFWMLPDLTVVSPETVRSMFLLAMEAGCPVVSFSEKYVELGALMSIGVDPYDMGRQAGRMACRCVQRNVQIPAQEKGREFSD
ncbi:MAG: ABC transporter substrate-binding protein [Desulfosalsimonas sp.]